MFTFFFYFLDGAEFAKPKAITFWNYAKVEMKPPLPNEIPQIAQSLTNIAKSAQTGAWKKLTVKVSFYFSFLCWLTCQSADIMASLCGVRVRMNNFSSKSTRPIDTLFVLKDTLSIEDETLFKACRSICLSSPEPLQVRYPHPKC